MSTMTDDGGTYERYVKALLAGDRHVCAQMVEEQRKKPTSVKDIYGGLFQRSLYDVGELWELNRISVATEHLATSITEGIMNRLFGEMISPLRANRKVVVASVEGELHQVGAKMVADVFEMHGWDSFYLGAGTPTKELIRFCREISPDVVGLSLSVYFHIGSLEDAIVQLRESFPDMPVVVGGQAFRWGGASLLERFKNVTYLSSLDDLEHYIRRRA